MKLRWICYSLIPLILVNITEKTRTAIMIIRSIIISNESALENNVTIPTSHITIKTIGNRYLIINDQMVPTLNVEC